MPPIPFAFSPLLLPRLDRGKGARVPVRRRRRAPAPAAIVPAAPRSTLSAHAPVLLALFVLEPRLGILDLRVKLGASFQVHTSIRQKRRSRYLPTRKQDEDYDRVGMVRSSRHETTLRRVALRERG